VNRDAKERRPSGDPDQPIDRQRSLAGELLPSQSPGIVHGKSTSKERAVSARPSLGLVAFVGPRGDGAPFSHESHLRAYDQAGRLESFAAPRVAPEITVYTAFSETGESLMGSKSVAHGYDDLGRLVNSSWSGAYSEAVDRTYDGAGNQASLQDLSRRMEMEHVAWRGLPFRERLLLGAVPWKSQEHRHDLAGNRTGLVDPESKLHEWPVDANNRVTSIQYDGGSVREMKYTVGGLLDEELLKSAGGAEISKTIHSYNRAGDRVRACTLSLATGRVTSDLAWEYDELHRVTAIRLAHLNAGFEIGYTLRDEVSGESTPGNDEGLSCPPFSNVTGGASIGNQSAFSSEVSAEARPVTAVPPRDASWRYDPAGNRVSQTVEGVTTDYLYNEASQLVSESSPAGTVTHQYDEWGNEISRTSPAGTETYGYNYLNRMSSYTNSATGAAFTYEFWPDGARAAKRDAGTGSAELYATRFGDVAVEYDGSMAPTNSYVQGTGIDSKSTRIPFAGGVEAPGGRRHYAGDLVGTVHQTLDDSGGVADQVVRDVWGVTVAGSSTERYGFAQRESDSESGLVYMRHRMYDPRTGRFTQTDPIRNNRVTEHYLYAGNNPTLFRDPTGEIKVSIGATAFIPGRWIDDLKGDNRQIGQRNPGTRFGSSRVWSFIEVEVDGAKQQNPLVLQGSSVSSTTQRVVDFQRSRPGALNYDYFEYAPRSDNSIKQHATRIDDKTVLVSIDVTAFPGGSGLVFPGIDYHYEVLLKQHSSEFGGEDFVTYVLTGHHDGFPNYEVFIQDELAYGYDHRSASDWRVAPRVSAEEKKRIRYGGGETPFSLYGSGEWTAVESGSVTEQK